MSNRHKDEGNCPICGARYCSVNRKSRHHIFPRAYYNIGITVELCTRCHIEFHQKNIIPNHPKWSMLECIKRFYTFCYNKGKDLNELYPYLMNKIMLS